METPVASVATGGRAVSYHLASSTLWSTNQSI